MRRGVVGIEEGGGRRADVVLAQHSHGDVWRGGNKGAEWAAHRRSREGRRSSSGGGVQNKGKRQDKKSMTFSANRRKGI